MATPWDRVAATYTDEWVPRFIPYHLDLVRESLIKPGQRVLIACAGPGSEVLAAAREVGDTGFIRATDASAEMVKLCEARVKKAGFKNVECEQADASDATGGPWDLILCAFGLWQLPDRAAVLASWKKALTPQGKVGIVTWGPPQEDDPFEMIGRCLKELEPDYAPPNARHLSVRDSMGQMFEEAGLAMVRHTIVRHTMAFSKAEAFVNALKEGAWRKIWEDLGEARFGLVAAKFCSLVGGPEQPLAMDPPATLVIATHPGAEVELMHRPSVRAPE